MLFALLLVLGTVLRSYLLIRNPSDAVYWLEPPQPKYYVTADLQMSPLWAFTWIWALQDYSLRKDYGSNPSQSQVDGRALLVLWEE